MAKALQQLGLTVFRSVYALYFLHIGVKIVIAFVDVRREFWKYADEKFSSDEEADDTRPSGSDSHQVACP
ncbi:hypothetical protein [Pseudomonas sp. GL-R-26]|uniref:hypothetical protein n=1 Tax=Pseudomonas sp. GL-R-26 TaxID=2832392 RepID=UPI001CBEF103|nr:hypothetical protein [Pseudomonas sp. GL-R-26]